MPEENARKNQEAVKGAPADNVIPNEGVERLTKPEDIQGFISKLLTEYEYAKNQEHGKFREIIATMSQLMNSYRLQYLEIAKLKGEIERLNGLMPNKKKVAKNAK